MNRTKCTVAFWMAMLLAITLAACGGGGGTTVVTNNTQSGLKSFVQFSFANPAANGVINEANKTIAVTVPFGTNVTALVASFTTTGQSVKVNGITQASGATANNFSNAVPYTVTAENGTTATYIVTVTVAANTAKAITAFSFAYPAATGVINESAKSISVTVPNGTNATSLVASFTTTGQSVKVNGVAQVSGTTANNFSNAVLYTVTAADGSTVSYTVTVIVAPSNAKVMTSFSFPALNATGIINEVTKTITVNVLSGSNVSGLVAAFNTSGVSVSVGAVNQVSGFTVNNFTAPVLYTVTAADGSSATYTVTVILGLPGVNWTVRTSGTANALNGVACSGTQFVAVGNSGIILSSPDGVAWTVRFSGTMNQLLGVIWSGTQFVAVGGGTILTSPDGVMWTVRNPGTANFSGVTWSGTQYVAASLQSTIYASPDAATWVYRAGVAQSLTGVAWSGTQFVSVGYLGTVLTSPDGITWTARTSGTTFDLLGVTWSGTQFVAIGTVGTILTSADGITWTIRTSGTTNHLVGITWSGLQFVAVGWPLTPGASAIILTSPDGIAWAVRASGTTNILNSVTWSGTKFVAVGQGGTILTSP